MRILIHANVIVRAILGSANRLGKVIRQGADVLVVDAQLVEARDVLIRLGSHREAAEELIASVVAEINVISLRHCADAEPDARARLHDRGQRDWPVLAAALTLGIDIWSDDRDFFGVGVPVWSTRNISHAFPHGAENA